MVVVKPFSSPYSNILVLNIFLGFQASPVSCLVIRGSTGGILSLISVARGNNTLTIHLFADTKHNRKQNGQLWVRKLTG